jgi:hypothetical protein
VERTRRHCSYGSKRLPCTVKDLWGSVL